jgi:hypothetical protein
VDRCFLLGYLLWRDTGLAGIVHHLYVTWPAAS